MYHDCHDDLVYGSLNLLLTIKKWSRFVNIAVGLGVDSGRA